jgi:hypothetical protein
VAGSSFVFGKLNTMRNGPGEMYQDEDMALGGAALFAHLEVLCTQAGSK